MVIICSLCVIYHHYFSVHMSFIPGISNCHFVSSVFHVLNNLTLTFWQGHISSQYSQTDVFHQCLETLKKFILRRPLTSCSWTCWSAAIPILELSYIILLKILFASLFCPFCGFLQRCTGVKILEPLHVFKMSSSCVYTWAGYKILILRPFPWEFRRIVPYPLSFQCSFGETWCHFHSSSGSASFQDPLFIPGDKTLCDDTLWCAACKTHFPG